MEVIRILESYSDALVESTTVTYNTAGVWAQNNSNPDLGQASGGAGTSNGQNAIHHSTNHHVVNLTEGVTIMAEDNYWAKTRPPCLPKSTKFIGSVDYNPALCSDPSPAPRSYLEEEITKLPSTFEISQNYPNPFNPITTFKYQVPPPGSVVKIAVYNVKGEVVKRLLNKYEKPGFYTLSWDGINERGTKVSTGIY